MGFIESYKRLDNLCKDLLSSEKGVASYIEIMEDVGNRYLQIENWESDYRSLNSRSKRKSEKKKKLKWKSETKSM